MTLCTFPYFYQFHIFLKKVHTEMKMNMTIVYCVSALIRQQSSTRQTRVYTNKIAETH